MIAVAASRWRFVSGEPQAVARWWYDVTVEGARGARYLVKILHTDGRAPVPFKVTRSGRSTRSLGRSAPDLRHAVEEAARAAIVTNNEGGMR